MGTDHFITLPSWVFLTDGNDEFYGGNVSGTNFVNPGKGSDIISDFGHVHYDVHISDAAISDISAHQISANSWVIGQSETTNILFEIGFDANGDVIVDGSGGIDASQGLDVLSSDSAFNILSFDIDSAGGIDREISLDIDFTTQSIWEATNFFSHSGTENADNDDARSLLDAAGFGSALGHLNFEYQGLGGDDVFDGSTASVGSYNLKGGDGNDTITVGDASSNARVEGGLGNDKIYVGNESRAWILPGEGQDEIYGMG